METPQRVDRRKPRRRNLIALPLAVAVGVTGITVAVGATATGEPIGKLAPLATADIVAQINQSRIEALDDVSRALRPLPVVRTQAFQPRAIGVLYATEDLRLRRLPEASARLAAPAERGDALKVTGQVVNGFAEILVEGKPRYAKRALLAREKPVLVVEGPTGAVPAVAGLSAAPCSDGSSIESGLTSSAVRMYRAVCAAFPAMSVYGGRDPHGEHFDGRAIDFMTSDPALGNAIAEFLRANASALGVRDVIWAQRIWTPERAGEGWRSMSNRGSATANHYDHVHAAVY